MGSLSETLRLAAEAPCIPRSGPVEFLGFAVWIREPTVAEQEALEDWKQAKEAQDGPHATSEFRARLICALAVDEDGRHLFGEADVSAFQRLPFSTIDPLADLALEVFVGKKKAS